MSDASDADLRAFTRLLFHTQDSEQTAAPDPTRGNVAPREGAQVERPQPDAMMPFVRSVFGKDPDG